MYRNWIKRGIDIVLSGLGLVCLSWLYLILIIAVKVDDPGPAFFTQKRVGKNKALFELHKFRSMKMCTPRDTPTHLLENPEQYITRVGRFLRKSSLDELPQVWDIFVGKMSIIGPRPALWNQYDLISRVSSKVQKKFINSQRSCLSVGFSHFYGCFRHRTPFFSNIMLWICP